MSFLKAITTVGGLTGISRVAGFARDILTAAVLGAGPVADAFFVALKLPNFFRRVSAEGAFSVSFVPLYSRALEQESKEAADHFAGNALVVMFCALSVFSLLMMLAMPYVLYVVAPGFVGDALRYDLAVELSRITFPYLLLMSLVALLGGVLNARGHFGPFAFAPVLFNLCLIVALLLSDYAASAGHAMAWGVAASGVIQLLWMIWGLRRAKIRLSLPHPRIDEKITKLFRLMGPGVLGAGVMQVNLFADLIIASFLPTGAISYLYYADRLNQLPLGVVGIAIGTALLPMLSRALSGGDSDQARGLFSRALEYGLLLAVPAAIALMVIPLPLITVLFERGAFGAADSLISAGVLQAYALGLPAYVAIKVFSVGHWAREDTWMPVKISIIGTAVNIALSLAFMQVMGVAGIALATSLGGWLQLVLHRRALRTHSALQVDTRFKGALPRIIFASGAMGFVLYGLASAFEGWLMQGFALKLAYLGTLVGGGLGIYGALVFLLGLARKST